MLVVYMGIFWGQVKPREKVGKGSITPTIIQKFLNVWYSYLVGRVGKGENPKLPR